MTIFQDVDFLQILEQIREKGYCFCSNLIAPECLENLKQEVETLEFKPGNRNQVPLNQGTTYQVWQSHARAYFYLDQPEVPTANKLCHSLGEWIQDYSEIYSELKSWKPTEIGYQIYRNQQDHITPHRDRWSDQLLSVTLTLKGTAQIKIYEPQTDPPDYSKIDLIDSFEASSGTVMFLRAPGFGSGKQVIHEVMPPKEIPRWILNLRMREKLLKPPQKRFYD